MNEDEITERVVQPAIAEILRPDEIDRIRLTIEPGGDAVVDLIAHSEGCRLWLDGPLTSERAEELRAQLVADLQDFVAESRFGWGTWRGPAR